MNKIEIGNEKGPVVLFGHGWGRSHRDFIPIAEAISPFARSILFDLPGFGKSCRPTESWDTKDYARFIGEYIISELNLKQYLWVGHSFGGRIGLRLAQEKKPEPKQLVIVAGAGVKANPRTGRKLVQKYRSTSFKFAKRWARNENEVVALEEKYGSHDYVQSRQLGLRDIFVKTVSEDQSSELKNISVKTTLIYGERDTETPPRVGEKIAGNIANSQLIVCPEFDHISILDRGRHQVALAIKEALI